MKIWSNQERLKHITHLCDLAQASCRQREAAGDPAGAAENARDALSCVRLLATASDEELDANRQRIARHF